MYADRIRRPAYPVDCRWTLPLVTSLRHNEDFSHMTILKWLVMANHTHAWWYNRAPIVSVVPFRAVTTQPKPLGGRLYKRHFDEHVFYVTITIDIVFKKFSIF